MYKCSQPGKFLGNQPPGFVSFSWNLSALACKLQLGKGVAGDLVTYQSQGSTGRSRSFHEIGLTVTSEHFQVRSRSAVECVYLQRYATHICAGNSGKIVESHFQIFLLHPLRIYSTSSRERSGCRPEILLMNNHRDLN